jgi:hypothetical protein
VDRPLSRVPPPLRSQRPHPILSSNLFHLHRRSLLRGSLLVLISLVAALLLSGFPNDRATPLLILPTIVAAFGTADTIRCMQTRWSWYHGGVILCVYMDLMAICIILFFLLYPYMQWLTSSR